MLNIKGLSISTDGDMKRLATTFDEINDNGKVTKSNARINRLVTDEEALAAIDVLWNYASQVIEEG